jgi:NADH-quinone oxidoreductase subunit E
MERKFKRVSEIVHEYGKQESKLIPILSAVQDEYRYLPEEVMTYVAMLLGISVSKVFGVASFYSHFSLKPKGKYVFKICDGTACHVKGAEKIYHKLQKELGLSDENPTSDDMLFTVETVSCLGACGLAPVVVVNEKVYGQVTEEQSVEIVKELQEKEAANV